MLRLAGGAMSRPSRPRAALTPDHGRVAEFIKDQQVLPDVDGLPLPHLTPH
jgi:hypothetical protein